MCAIDIKIYMNIFYYQYVIGKLPRLLLPFRLYHPVSLDERASPQFSSLFSTYF